MMGFFSGGTARAIGAVCGILACVASSILMCCAPRSTKEGGCKFTAVRCPMMSPGISGRRPRLIPAPRLPPTPHHCDHPMLHVCLLQAGVLLLLAGIVQLIMGSIVILQITAALNEVRACMSN